MSPDAAVPMSTVPVELDSSNVTNFIVGCSVLAIVWAVFQFCIISQTKYDKNINPFIIFQDPSFDKLNFVLQVGCS